MRDEDPGVDVDRRDRRAAAVEHDDVGIEARRQLGACDDVRDERRTGHPAAGTPAADRRHAGEQRRLEMVGRGVPPAAGERDEIVERRRRLDQLRRRGAAPPHRDDDDTPVAGERAATAPVTAVLPTRLPVPITASDGGANG